VVADCGCPRALRAHDLRPDLTQAQNAGRSVLGVLGMWRSRSHFRPAAMAAPDILIEAGDVAQVGQINDRV